jgi:DNA repair exonuclease SbcCD ATPase subunit
MRVKKVRLRNVYQHRFIEVDITGSRIGLIGPNGGGKSNFLHCLGEMITGEFHQPKDRVVTRGETDGEMFQVIELQNKTVLEITREFPSGAATLKITSSTGTEEIIKGPAKVNERILRELATDKSVLQNIVFVGQKEIDDVLFARAGEKDRLAQRFFGLQDANSIEKLLTKEMSSLTSDSFASSLPTLIESRAIAAAKVAELEVQAAGREPPEVIKASILGLENQLQAISSLNAKILGYRAILESHSSYSRRYAEAYERYSKEHASHSSVDIQSARQSLDFDTRAEKAMSDLAAIKREGESLAIRFREMGEVPFQPDQIERLSLIVEALRVEVENLSSQATPKIQALSRMSAVSKCPTCGQSIDISARAAIEAELADLNPRLQQKRAELSQATVDRDRMARAVELWNNNSSHLKASLDLYEKRVVPAEQAVAELGKDFVPNSSYWRKIISDHDSCASFLQRNYETLMAIKADLDATTTRMASYGPEVIGPDGQSATIVDTVGIQAEIARKRDEQMFVHSLSASLAGARANESLYADQIVKAKASLSQNNANSEIRDILSAARTVFHPDGAPKILVARSTKRLEVRVNHYLAIMKAEFRVSAREGLSFNCHFENGISLDTELSVGQKVALSWSFRLAACETFSSSVGLMTMDEPTATLDARTSSAFLDVMEAMGEMSVNYGMQFFIATHSKELAATCDQIIDVKPD